MRFIDLFAGLGGFHKALHHLGHECVFASELDPTLRQKYQENWGVYCHGDIKKIVDKQIEIIPEHDILCAGFPCQPFSKAGKQLGRKDDRGTLFDEIIKILEFRKPQYFILENVPFIAKHDNEDTWRYMKSELQRLGYIVNYKVYSPHEFGVPQHRKRIFIVGSRISLDHFDFKEVDKEKVDGYDIYDYIENEPTNFKRLPKANTDCLKIWQEFLNSIPKYLPVPTFPIWAMEFGATYPYDGKPPSLLSSSELGNYCGNFGRELGGMSKKDQLAYLPSYARVQRKFPSWKQRYIEQNRQFYKENKKYLSEVAQLISELPSQSWQKLEWNVGENKRKILDYIIQFRASGIRVKKVDFFPSLVCTNTQIPIIGWQKRYISTQEGLRLQSLEGIKLPENSNAAFKALGNAVNAKIIELIAAQLIKKTTNGNELVLESIQDYFDMKVIRKIEQ